MEQIVNYLLDQTFGKSDTEMFIKNVWLWREWLVLMCWMRKKCFCLKKHMTSARMMLRVNKEKRLKVSKWADDGCVVLGDSPLPLHIFYLWMHMVRVGSLNINRGRDQQRRTFSEMISEFFSMWFPFLVFTDHHLVTLDLHISPTKKYSSYWHFNVKLLKFEAFWEIRKRKEGGLWVPESVVGRW